jgi:DNA repair protein RadC
VHPREVFALAVRESAAAVIFLHNHPSGDPTPSQEDRLLTDRLITAGKLLGIRVLDHVIVGDGRYVSFADEGWMAGQRDEREDP